MRTLRFPALRRTLPLLVALTLVLIATAGAYADNTHSEDVDILPYYARISTGEIFHDNDWAVVVFYRPPECVPVDFNLLMFYDFDYAFGCVPMTVDGFIIWDEPMVQPALISVHGLGAVPVWFVSWDEMQGAVADGILTIGELSELPSLMIGFASNYHEMLQPYPTLKGKIEYSAKGSLEDGRSFQVHAVWVRDHELKLDIEIR